MPEVCDPVARRAQADQPPQRLDPRAFVVAEPLVRIQERPVLRAGRSQAAGLAAPAGPAPYHLTDAVPVALADRAPDVAIPARCRDRVREQALSEPAVFPAKDGRQPGPALECPHARRRSPPAVSSR